MGGKSRFVAALERWLEDVPGGEEKVFGSIVFGRKPYLTIFDEADKFVAASDEPLELGCGEVEPHIFSLGIVDDDTDKWLRADRAFNDAAGEPDFLRHLGNRDFPHNLPFRGDSALPTIAEAGGAGHPDFGLPGGGRRA